MPKPRKKRTGAKVITASEVGTRRQPLPVIWKKAFGLLKGKYGDSVKYQRKLRGEWNHRP